MDRPFAPAPRLARLWPPRPGSRIVMRQRWEELLFAHWSFDPEVLRPRLPAPLELDTREGLAWLGVTPFRLTGLRAPGLPAVPVVSRFPELNVRTYVRFEGRAGIFFFTLEAGRALAVLGARLGFRLPYRLARMRIRRSGGWIDYESRRRGAHLAVRYRPVGPAAESPPGGLEHFLTERYSLFVGLSDRSVLRVDVVHAPWRLRPAAAVLREVSLLSSFGLARPDAAPLLHFSERQDVAVLRPARITGAGR